MTNSHNIFAKPMLTNIAQIRLLLTASCLSLTIITVGCNQSANSNSAAVNRPASQATDRPPIAKPLAPENRSDPSAGSTIAQANQPEKSQSTKILDGRYLVGHTGQGLEVDGDRYRYTDEEGEKPWRSITELNAIKAGVIYDGNSHWCLNTMKSRDQIGSCAETGWVIYQPPTDTDNSLTIPALQKEMSYDAARQLIIDAGWQPLVTNTDNPQDGTKSWRDRGYNEVSSCSGTGMGFCRFEFTGSGNQKLVIVTGGRESTVQKWWEETADRANTVETSNLPFVGKRLFNFLGGSGTGYSITIESNGNTVIQHHGTMNSSTIYQGPFQETMTTQDGQRITIKDGYANSCNPQEPNADAESAPCKAKLYE